MLHPLNEGRASGFSNGPAPFNAGEGHDEAPTGSDKRPTEPHRLSKRVLVVDDNVDGADMLGLLLETSGHEVVVRHDPLSALQALDAFMPEVAILDIGLPGMDGYELAVRIRQQLGNHPCRLIALTGYGQDADRHRSREAGFERHLVKPVNPLLVTEVVSEAA